jgi:RNA polymerase sigma-70 factor (ECF subfamily)
LSDHELRIAVRRALEQVEPHYRLALTLFYFDDMKYTDIAEVLDLPLNTVKSHIRRGKERLQALLAEYNDSSNGMVANDGAVPQRAPAPAVRPGPTLLSAGV